MNVQYSTVGTHVKLADRLESGALVQEDGLGHNGSRKRQKERPSLSERLCCRLGSVDRLDDLSGAMIQAQQR